MSSNITIVGNLTRDPEIRYTPNGAQSVQFGVAVNRRWQDRQTSEWKEDTSFFDVVCWRDLADNVAESLTKGARIIVTGRLTQRSWENDGERRSKVEIVADEVGPSLRWATATVNKVDRRGPDGGGGGRPVANQPSDTSAAAGAAGDSGSSGAGHTYDEEPF